MGQVDHPLGVTGDYHFFRSSISLLCVSLFGLADTITSSKKKTGSFIQEIRDLHEDAISSLVLVFLEKKFEVWSGSWDRTICAMQLLEDKPSNESDFPSDEEFGQQKRLRLKNQSSTESLTIDDTNSTENFSEEDEDISKNTFNNTNSKHKLRSQSLEPERSSAIEKNFAIMSREIKSSSSLLSDVQSKDEKKM